MYKIRPATVEDVEIITAQRRGMFLDMSFPDDEGMARMAEEFKPWLRQKMEAGDYLAWFAVDEEETVVSGLGLWMIEWPPHLVGTAKHRGYILNVYTDPAHRRNGLAKQLTQIAVDWCKSHGIDFVFLHASKFGRPVYESLGFQPGTEMRLRF